MRQSRLVTGVAVVTAVAAGGVGGALIGVPGLSGAQTFPRGATTAAAAGTTPAVRPLRDSALLDAAAKALNLTTQQLRDKLSDGKTTIADVAQQQNVDINTVIDAIAAADRDRITNIVNNPWPKFGPGEGIGPRGGLRMGRGGFGFGMIGDGLDSVAKALGITTAELQTDLGNGQSIADIAKSKNIDVNTVIDTLVGEADAKIDQAVKDGNVQPTQADKIKANIKPMITDLVNNSLPKGFGPMTGAPMPGGPMGGGFGFHRRGGFGGPPSSSSPPSTTAPTA